MLKFHLCVHAGPVSSGVEMKTLPVTNAQCAVRPSEVYGAGRITLLAGFVRVARVDAATEPTDHPGPGLRWRLGRAQPGRQPGAGPGCPDWAGAAHGATVLPTLLRSTALDYTPFPERQFDTIQEGL